MLIVLGVQKLVPCGQPSQSKYLFPADLMLQSPSHTFLRCRNLACALRFCSVLRGLIPIFSAVLLASERFQSSWPGWPLLIDEFLANRPDESATERVVAEIRPESRQCHCALNRYVWAFGDCRVRIDDLCRRLMLVLSHLSLKLASSSEAEATCRECDMSHNFASRTESASGASHGHGNMQFEKGKLMLCIPLESGTELPRASPSPNRWSLSPASSSRGGRL